MPSAVLRRTVAGLFMIGIPGPTLDRATRAFLAEHPPGGIVLFKRNVRSAEQLRALTTELHRLGPGIPPIVAIDHEGGRVHRLPAPFTHFPPAATVGDRADPRVAESVGLAMGRELAAVGIDVDFAPVLDVRSEPRNKVIGDRAFGTTAPAVVRAALPFARGLERGGVLPCGKHFPGHGASIGDSHFVLPRVRRSRAVLTDVDLVPFLCAVRARMPALMTAHVVFPALDPKHPATLSRRIGHDLLRRRLGFEGVLFSDDLEMQAVAGRRAPDRLAVAALRAGCDMLLVCQSLDTAARAMRGIERAVERRQLLPDDIVPALCRIQALRRRVPERRETDRLAWPAHARLANRLTANA